MFFDETHYHIDYFTKNKACSDLSGEELTVLPDLQIVHSPGQFWWNRAWCTGHVKDPELEINPLTNQKKNRNHKPDRIYLKICEHVYIEPIKMICWKYTYVALCAWTHSIEQPQAQNHPTPHCTTHVLCKITRLTFKTWLFTLYSVLHTSTHSPLSTPDCTLPSPHFTLYTE